MWSVPRFHIGTLLFLVFINALHYVNKYYKVQFRTSVKAVNNEHIKIKKTKLFRLAECEKFFLCNFNKRDFLKSKNKTIQPCGMRKIFCVISIKEIF